MGAWLFFDLIFGVPWFGLFVVSWIIDVSSVDSEMFEFKSNASGRVVSFAVLDSDVLESFVSVESLDVCLNYIKYIFTFKHGHENFNQIMINLFWKLTHFR